MTNVQDQSSVVKGLRFSRSQFIETGKNVKITRRRHSDGRIICASIAIPRRVRQQHVAQFHQISVDDGTFCNCEQFLRMHKHQKEESFTLTPAHVGFPLITTCTKSDGLTVRMSSWGFTTSRTWSVLPTCLGAVVNQRVIRS